MKWVKRKDIFFASRSSQSKRWDELLTINIGHGECVQRQKRGAMVSHRSTPNPSRRWGIEAPKASAWKPIEARPGVDGVNAGPWEGEGLGLHLSFVCGGRVVSLYCPNFHNYRKSLCLFFSMRIKSNCLLSPLDIASAFSYLYIPG